MRGYASSTVVLVLTILISLPAAANAADYIEGAPGNPDISGNGLAPTNLNLAAGANTVSGTFGGPDTDILHVNIPAGLQLSTITLNAHSTADLAFIGVKAGSTWSGNPNFDGMVDGYVHISPSLVGSDILDDIAASSGGAVSPPLSGDYTFWMQNATTSGNAYSLSFNVVPEPASVALLAVAGFATLCRRRRR